MAVMASARFRAKVLEVASGLTSDRDCAAAVAVNASPLLAWLEGAADEDDMRARWRAMFQHHLNTMYEPRDDNPDRFLSQVRTLYAFMTAGQGG
jgi:hypothetical protein